MIYVLTSENAAAFGLSDSAAWVKIETRDLLIPGNRKVQAGNKIQAQDRVYLDISGFPPSELNKAVGRFIRRASFWGISFWGIIDPQGAAEDPAAFFFKGASDYIGPAMVKKGLSRKRFEAACSGNRGKENKTDLNREEADSAGNQKKKNQKLPAGKFPGWTSIPSGTAVPFFFLFAAISKESKLRAMVGETTFNTVKNRFRDALQQNLRDADALLWIEAEDNYLFLVPPRAPNGRAVVEAALKMVMNSRLVGIEKMRLSIPVEFTFALHYGKTVFQAPGKTGAVVAESVNYIFHLGTKKAEAGRLTVSDDVSEEALPEGLLELFSPAGVFEGISLRHSKRFCYK